MQEAAIILAAGKGSRFESAIPKQFSILNKWPMLWHSVHCFHSYNPRADLILVLHPDDMARWKDLVKTHKLALKHRVVEGGSSRSESVAKALNHIGQSELIFIHDSARPFINVSLLERLKKGCESHGNAIPVFPSSALSSDQQKDGSKTLKLDETYLIQTPQVFGRVMVQRAYGSHFDPSAKDDSEIVQKAGFPLHYILGIPENIKITFPSQKTEAEQMTQTS